MDMVRVSGSNLPYPGFCCTCGSSNTDSLDLGFTFEDENVPQERLGAALMCENCFRHAAQIMGYEPIAEKVDLVKDTTEVSNQALDYFKVTLAEVKAHVDAMHSTLSSATGGNAESYPFSGRNDPRQPGSLGNALTEWFANHGISERSPIPVGSTGDTGGVSAQSTYSDRNGESTAFDVKRVGDEAVGDNSAIVSNAGDEGPDSVSDGNGDESANEAVGSAAPIDGLERLKPILG